MTNQENNVFFLMHNKFGLQTSKMINYADLKML